jgi:molybdopterin molybdotransferase
MWPLLVGGDLVLDFETALAEVMRHASLLRETRTTPATESVPLLESAGRVLAESVLADRDQPPFDRSTRDGFAVISADLAAGIALKIVGQVRAGDAWAGSLLAPGEAIEIMTGAPIPAGADAVVMIEHVTVTGDRVALLPGRTLHPGENIVLRGSEAHRGDAVVAAGSLIAAAEIAEAATCGRSTLQVFVRPRVAIVATGDELVEIHETSNERQIRNSNSYGLAAMVAATGATPVRLETARDTREDVRDRITHGRTSGFLLFSGGVSMGKYDLVEEVLAEFHAEFFFTGVKMQPGKPLVFGRLPPSDVLPECYFFGLPGNPISTQVTFHCFVEPFLRVLCGEAVTGPRFVQATLVENVPGKSGVMRVLPARLMHDLKTPSIKLIPWHGSGDLAANARANCYAILPPHRPEFHAGDVISVLLR